MNRILLPTDFSENAWNAIRYALTIFKNRPCDFFIFNSYQLGASGLMTTRGKVRDTRYFRLMKEESTQKLNDVLQNIKGMNPSEKHTFHVISKSGDFISALGSTVIEERIDGIIMGTKGASGLKEVFMGSNAHKVIKTIDFCPIIAVPNQWKPNNKADQILLATGFEHLFEGYEFEPLLDFAKLVQSKILVGYVGDSSDFSVQQQSTKKLTERFLKDTDVEFIAIKEVGFIHESIQCYIENNPRIGMLAMINYWHNFIEKLMHEPTIKKMAFNCNVPLLITHVLE